MARIARGDEFVDSALKVIANAVTVKQMRQALAVALPLRFGMSFEQTAQIAGVSVRWASRLRNRFILDKPVGDASVPARGGRRHQNFTFEQEAALLKPFLQQASEGGAKPSSEHIVNDVKIVTRQNIARCCLPCNASKGARDLRAWLASNY